MLRKVAARDLDTWVEELTRDETDATRRAAVEHSHPEWIVRALRQSLVAHGRSVDEITDLLKADNDAPVVNLVALPGLGNLDEARAAGAVDGELVVNSALYSAGDVGRLDSVRAGTTRVQDAGSQLVARALAGVDIGDRTADGSRDGEQWLDLCAGPGGKAALLAALANEKGAILLANEPAEHRAKLVRQALEAVPGEVWDVRTGDGRSIAEQYPDTFDRILVDDPCTGLGALQRQLLIAAVDAVKAGGVVAYVTCSPHPAETTAVVADVLRQRNDLELLDAGAALDAVSLTGNLGAGHESTAQLWPHIHQTDAMFLALIRRKL